MLFLLSHSFPTLADALTPTGQIEASGPDELVIPLKPSTRCDGGMHTPRSRDNFPNGPQHPNADRIEHYYATRIGSSTLMVGLEQANDVWSVSADIDADGTIQESERFTMLKQTSTSDEQVYEAKISISYPTPEIPDNQVNMILRLQDKPDGLIMETCVKSGRTGEIPTAGGVSFELSGIGGDFSQPGAKLIIDGDRDGSPDELNFLNHYTMREGLVLLPDEKVYAMSVDAAGTALRLKPTDKALTGLHFLAPAPQFEAKATDGKTHSLSQYAGEVVLLDFWATWCAPCIALHPEVEQFAEEQNLRVLGISADDTLQDV